MAFQDRPRYSEEEVKLSLNAFLFEEGVKGTKDWFGYLRINEEDVEPLAKILRHGTWTTDREGTRHLTLKISGWNRKSERGDWIKLLVGQPTRKSKIPAEVIDKPHKTRLIRSD